MSSKINKVLDYLINIRYFATVISKSSGNALSKNGISCSESLYLLLLKNHQEGLTMSELSALMKVDKSLTTRIIKNLLENEYILKDIKTINSRNYKIKLTSKGIKKVAVIEKILIDKYELFVNKFTEQEIKILEDAFELVQNKFSTDV